MQDIKVKLEDTKRFSDTFIKYINQDKVLEPYYCQHPSLEAIYNQIKKVKITRDTRKILSQSLDNQYITIDNLNPKVEKNIQLLKEDNTFTITTGHQLNIATGPLFFIYKIVTAINTAKLLNEKYQLYNFVPVYWMATEDHDLEEIQSFNLFGQKYIFETNQKGATGEMSTEGMQEFLNQLPEKIELLQQAYQQPTLSEATRHCVNTLFENEGLVILDANDRALKKQFIPIIEKEIFERKSYKIVENTAKALKEKNLKTLLYPRDINFFYLDKGIRERIIFNGEKYEINNTNISFTGEEMKSLIAETPEKISPNVVLRPVYQETILPNLCYIGGPSELVYWFQLKDVFKLYVTKFPILLPRKSAMIMREKVIEKWHNYGFELADLFENIHQLKNNYVERVNGCNVTLEEEKQEIKRVFDKISKYTDAVDKSLNNWVGAEYNKVNKTLDNIEKRISKIEKQKYERELNQIEKVVSMLFPNNQLQERYNNFFEYYINNRSILDKILSSLEPLDIATMRVISY